MRVLVIFAHPVAESFGGALHRTVVEALTAAGHEVDDCDLYAEDFQPVLTRQERLDYHNLAANRQPVESYVQRLERAEALVLVHPVWNYGFPAILKGYFDRVFLPGVSFKLENGAVSPNLQHITKLAAIVTYGGTRWRTFLMGNPPRRLFMRMLRALVKPFAPVKFLALYDMNNVGEGQRQAFLEQVRRQMANF
ncbi:NAD(P)H-dependent oxidoreductase [Radicibacter daui]|uniref:NAD(P)H-dependent oxidoreductase n=1 Tax=Radicibacter daui TaxID=3064829 RepID=UPI004046F54D